MENWKWLMLRRHMKKKKKNSSRDLLVTIKQQIRSSFIFFFVFKISFNKIEMSLFVSIWCFPSTKRKRINSPFLLQGGFTQLWKNLLLKKWLIRWLNYVTCSVVVRQVVSLYFAYFHTPVYYIYNCLMFIFMWFCWGENHHTTLF